MKIRTIFLSSILFCISLFANTYAEANYSQWNNVYLCPFVKNISKMFFINNTIYALTENEGLYKSADEGETWTSLKNGFPSGDIKMVDLVGDQENHLILAINESIHYAWSEGFLIERITMNSPAFYAWNAFLQQWEKIQTKGTPINVNMTNLVQDSKGILYASFDDSIKQPEPSFNEDIVYQSIDHGQHWINLKLKATTKNNMHPSSALQDNVITQTKMILDNHDNLYVKGISQYGNDQHPFVYMLQHGQTQWKDTGYSASDIFITGNGLLGILRDQGDISIKDLKLQGNGLLKENKSWTFTAPEQSTHPLIAIEHNNMYMLIRSDNHATLYQLNDVTNPALKWNLVKNGDANIPDVTSLALHLNHLYAVGSREMGKYQSMDIFQ